jgi:predicted Zn-dependent protease
VAAALVAAACLSFRDLPKNPLSSEISVEDEIELGSQIHKQVRASAPLIHDPLLLDFVNAIGQELVAATEPQPYTYRFSIVKNDELNAFAVPGGYVYIHSAVLMQAGDLSELAGVLAHEVAHVKLRHIARTQQETAFTNYAALAATIAAMASGDPKLAAAVSTIASGVNVSLQLKYSRAHEAEADREGIGYLVRAGFDPRGLVRFLERIQTTRPRGGEEIPPYLFSHPAPGERIDDDRRQIERMGLPPGLIWKDPRLALAQARMAALAEPIAGGSGLQARATFDASATDALLARAKALVADGAPDHALDVLGEAEQLEARDPRVPLARAELLEDRGDLIGAAEQLERAFKLDPSVPLVQYELGRIHKRLGHKSRAVFYLEQAAGNAAPGSTLARRAEFEIDALSWPVLEASAISSEPGGAERASFARGEPVVWWGRVSRRFSLQELAYEVRWLDPGGAIASRQALTPSALRWLSASFDSAGATPGAWKAVVYAGDGPLETREFEITGP